MKPIKLEAVNFVEGQYETPDMTAFVPYCNLESYCEIDKEWLSLLEVDKSIEEMVSLPYTSNTSDPVLGRGLTCLCWRGEWISSTVRAKAKLNNYTLKFKADIPTVEKELDACQFKPSPDPKDYLFSMKNVVDILMKFEELSKPGLIVIAGRTGSGKSEIVQGLIFHALCNELVKFGKGIVKRHPHLLTIENPIEAFLFKKLTSVEIQQNYGIDYTPRQIHDDVPSFRQALCKDALRQTPAITYVGETRTDDEWQALLEFAGTGHLVFTTTHSGSVRETLTKILEASGAKAPSDQGRIASRIRAIIHIDLIKLIQPDKAGLVPSIWLGTPAGVASLVADGPTSVIPNFPNGYNKNHYSLGRTWFLKSLLEISNQYTEDSQLIPAINSDLDEV